ncbi:MAG: hypothetical protein ACE5HX_15965, partial [bacterium]
MQKNSQFLGFRYVWILLIAICSLVLFSWLAFSQEKPLKRNEKIKFSHKFHQKEIETECTDCHVQAPESTGAGDNLLPTMTECESCHDIEDEENCKQCHFEDEETYLAFEVTPRELNFNHKLHIEQAEVVCETCHKNLAEVDFSDANSMPV